MRIHRTTTRPGPTERFTGQVWLDEITTGESLGLVAMNVHFSPGARTAWHTQPEGQVLHVTEGVGRVQSEGGPVTEIRGGRPPLRQRVRERAGDVHRLLSGHR
jgi:quercetin dioxygenase-like cupin family protein